MHRRASLAYLYAPPATLQGLNLGTTRGRVSLIRRVEEQTPVRVGIVGQVDSRYAGDLRAADDFCWAYSHGCANDVDERASSVRALGAVGDGLRCRSSFAQDRMGTIIVGHTGGIIADKGV